MRRVSTGRAAALSIRSHTLSGCDCKCQHVPLSPCCVKLEGAITHLSWVLASSAFLAACTAQTDNAAKTSISHTYSMNTQFNTCSVNLSLDLTYQKTQHQTLTAAPSMCSCLITAPTPPCFFIDNMTFSLIMFHKCFYTKQCIFFPT